MRWLSVLVLIFPAFLLQAQVTGGEQIMSFLRIAASTHSTALGGMSVSNPSADVSMSLENPALLRPEFHTSLGLSYQSYYAGSKLSSFVYAHYIPSLQTTFALALRHLNYGNFRLTDELGNITGTGQATDYVWQLSAARSYLNRWRYGLSCKYAHSVLLDQKATALLTDIGLMYADTTGGWYSGAAVKNAGIALKNYEQGYNQPLPIDLQIGVTKRFRKAPFSLMAQAHHLQTWNIRYDNPADATSSSLLFADTTTSKKNYFADKLFRHFVFAAELNLGKRLEITFGYNHLRRSELALSEKKGMSGFSYGVGLYLHRFVIHVAQSYYHIAGPTTQIGLEIRLNQLVGFGQAGHSIHWNESFTPLYR